ncbi:hypothetical protein Ahy_B08g093659 [Arachis hypogaea]|uniref:Ubiquitin-like protease family profile domain-containing protein n=1 Tax=Arachis hypogaea TaxID=3818 RepID=A0A444Y6L5_ARAHY|nr:hypothetical protein Ahy_B08g093659 [Arachis hypogaea]
MKIATETDQAKLKKTMVTKNEKPRYNKTHDCRCQTKAIATVFKNMSQEKRDIVKEMGFGASAHVPKMNISHALLRELIDCYDEYDGFLKTLQGKIYITPRKTRSVLDISVEGEENRQKFKRNFIVFVQKCFLLPTTVSVASPIHKPPIFHVDNIREWDWEKHVLSFLRKEIENKRKGNKQSVDGCVFVLMLLYFHETKFLRPFRPDAPLAPWVVHWTKQMMLDRISEEATDTLKANKEGKNKNKEIREERKSKERKKKKKIVDLDSSSEEDIVFESESESESDKTPLAKRTRQQRVVRKQKLVETDSETTTQTESSPTDSKSKSESENQTKQVKDSAAERIRQVLETIREKRSKKRNDGAQTANVAPDRFDLTEGQNDFSDTLSTVNMGSEPLLQTQASSTPSVNAPDNTKTNSHYSTLTSSLFTFLRASLALSLPSSLKEELIKDNFIYVPPESQTQQTSDNDSPPRQQQQQEALVAWQLEEEAQPYFVAHPRQWEDDVPSFSLGINPLASQVTPPSQPTQPSEPTVSQLEILKEAVVDAGVTTALKFAEATTAEPTFPAAEVYKTPEKKKEITEELIEKCYHWMTHVKQTKDSSNKYDVIFILKHEANYKGMFMLGSHGVDYTDPRTKKAYRFDIDQYAYHRRFLDKRKLASHPFYMKGVWFSGFASLYSLFMSLSGINNFPDKGLRRGGTLMEDGEGEEAKYIALNGQRTDYDCDIYVMKWLETIDPRKIKSGKRYQYKAWTQEEIDDFRHEYGPHILLHKMNKIRDQVIRTSKAIRLSKPSAALSSLCCKFSSANLESK